MENIQIVIRIMFNSINKNQEKIHKMLKQIKIVAKDLMKVYL
jgi:hypothetical protein